jgi:orotidine-5'-phosphate decarboxylase
MSDVLRERTRERLVLALDVGDLEAARRLALRLRPWFGTVKVGLELFAEAGPRGVEQLRDQGFRVFADLKLHDIPNTVERAARVLGRLGAGFCTFHAAGGVAMLEAGRAGLLDGARSAGNTPPVALAVTVLTSDTDTNAFDARIGCAREARFDAVVCSAAEIGRATDAGMRAMVPGIRLAGDDAHDQARVETPALALARGASWIVVGRSVTAAADPEAAAARVADEAERGLPG